MVGTFLTNRTPSATLDQHLNCIVFVDCQGKASAADVGEAIHSPDNLIESVFRLSIESADPGYVVPLNKRL